MSANSQKSSLCLQIKIRAAKIPRINPPYIMPMPGITLAQNSIVKKRDIQLIKTHVFQMLRAYTQC